MGFGDGGEGGVGGGRGRVWAIGQTSWGGLRSSYSGVIACKGTPSRLPLTLPIPPINASAFTAACASRHEAQPPTSDTVYRVREQPKSRSGGKKTGANPERC